MLKRLSYPLSNKRGIALLSVMLIFTVMSIMLGGMTVYSTSHLQRSDTNAQTAAAFYASEAGINVETELFTSLINNAVTGTQTLQQLISAINQYISNNISKEIPLNNNGNESVFAVVSIESLGEQGDMFIYRITSHGHVGDEIRTTSRDIMFRYVPGSPDNGTGFIIDKSILTRGNINASGLTVVGNPIGTYSRNNDAVNLSWSTFVPGVQIPQGTVKTDIVNIPDWQSYSTFVSGGVNSITYLEEIYEFPPIVMPSYPNPATLKRLPQFRMVGTNFDLIRSDGSLNHSGWSSNKTYVLPSTYSEYYLPSFIVENNERFTLDIGSNNVTLVVDRLNINGPMQLIGTGTLTIHVTGNTPQTRAGSASEKFTVSGGWSSPAIFGNQTHPERFKLFIHESYVRSGSSTVPLTMTVENNATLYLSLMAANMNIALTSSGRVDGYVVTGGTSVTVSGASNAAVTLYYTPNAEFRLTNSGSVNGAILSDRFTSSGNVRVTYSDVAFENFPFSVLDPITGGGSSNITPEFQLIKGPTFEH